MREQLLSGLGITALLKEGQEYVDHGHVQSMLPWCQISGFDFRVRGVPYGLTFFKREGAVLRAQIVMLDTGKPELNRFLRCHEETHALDSWGQRWRLSGALYRQGIMLDVHGLDAEVLAHLGSIYGMRRHGIRAPGPRDYQCSARLARWSEGFPPAGSWDDLEKARSAYYSARRLPGGLR